MDEWIGGDRSLAAFLSCQAYLLSPISPLSEFVADGILFPISYRFCIGLTYPRSLMDVA